MNDVVGIERLSALCGTWCTNGQVLGQHGEPSAPFTAIDSYQWLPGRHFLVHHWDAAMPDGRSQGIEMIGYDAESDHFPMHAYDSDGNVTEMAGSYNGTSMQFEGAGVRFRGEFSSNCNEITGTWEVQPDGNGWHPWMHVTLTRQE